MKTYCSKKSFSQHSTNHYYFHLTKNLPMKNVLTCLLCSSLFLSVSTIIGFAQNSTFAHIFGDTESNSFQMTQYSNAHNAYFALGMSGDPLQSTFSRVSETGNWEWTQKYNADFTLKEFVQTPTGDFLLVGRSPYRPGTFPNNGNNPIRLVVLKVNANGNLLWEKEYNHPQANLGHLRPSACIVHLGNDEYVVSSTFRYNNANAGNGYAGIFLLKIDAAGNVIDNQTLHRQKLSVRDIKLDNNGDILLTGQGGFGGTPTANVVVKVDPNTLLPVNGRATFYPSNTSNITLPLHQQHLFMRIIALPNGTYAVAGFYQSHAQVFMMTLNADFTVNKIVVHKSDIPNITHAFMRELILDNNNNIYLSGHRENAMGRQAFVIKYDMNANVLWEQFSDANLHSITLQATANGKLIAGSAMENNVYGAGDFDALLMISDANLVVTSINDDDMCITRLCDTCTHTSFSQSTTEVDVKSASGTVNVQNFNSQANAKSYHTANICIGCNQ